jgi:LPS-assembly protein
MRPYLKPASFPPHRLSPLVLAWLCGMAAPVCAQEGLKLKPQLQISDESSKEAKRPQDQGPIFLRADKVSGVLDDEMTAEGNAEMRKRGLSVKADVLRYQSVSDIAEAKGNVRLNREGNIYTGPELKLTTETGEGVFRLPTYRLAKTGGGGTASRIAFLDKRRSVAYDATYTTCPRDDVAWQLTADEVQLDFDEEEGIGTDVRLTFKGVPLIVAPKLSFPLSDKRRSGFLPPQIDLSTNSGFEFSQPYYWDIAPNRDLTFTPSLISKRGVLFGNEFRYLEPSYQGQLQADWLPRDALKQQEQRWGVGLRHTGTAFGVIGYSANIARVGDDDYWKDLPRSISAITQSTLTATQRQLPADFNATYGVPYGYVTSRFLRYQTLQTPADLIGKPYDIEPQLAGHWERLNWRGFDALFDTQWTRFRHETYVSGERSVFAPSISYPLQAPGYFVIPKLNVRQTSYHVNTPLADGRNTASMTVATLSLDSGLVFERSTRFFDKPYVQTLEPRAFIVNTPYRDQSRLPNFDSGLLDFSFASIYSDNAYSGYDRVSDDKTLTLGLSSRVLEEATGAERLRLQFAQRVRFADQRVTASNVPNTERLSDALFGVSFSPNEKVAFDTTVQYNPDIRRSVRSVLGARYTPAPFKTLAFGYSLNRNAAPAALEQFSVAWQWPLDFAGLPQLYTVGRVNYSREEARVTDAIAGLEWERACWLFRLVAQRTSQDVKVSSTRLYLQLELKGLTRLGTNPLATLMSNIPQYRILGQPAERTSPYNAYE